MSVSERISGAITTVIGGLGLTPTPTVRQRKRPNLLDGEQPPLIVVAVAADPTSKELAYKGTWLVRYPASIAVAFARVGKSGDNPTLRTWVDAIWPALADWRNLGPAGLPEVNSLDPRAESLFDKAGLAAQLDWGVIDALVETLEKRY